MVDNTTTSTDRVGAPTWIPQARFEDFTHLRANFPCLVKSLNMQSSKSWTPWASKSVSVIDFPNIALNHTSFQRLLLVQALRPEGIELAMQMFVCTALKLESIVAPPVVLCEVFFKDFIPSLPVLFITAPGADPSLELEEFAARTVGKSNYHQLAMGQGQAEEALLLLQMSAKSGSWVCLKNLHLVVSWLPFLEQEIFHLSPHPGFRLWLTTEPHEHIPRSLLEASLKITCEPPPGFRNKLQAVLGAWTPEMFSKRTSFELELLFVLSVLHAIVQERCTYLPQGWTKLYEFTFADLRFGADILHSIADELPEISLPYIQGMLLNVIYGGHIDNKIDFGLFEEYVKRYFSKNLLDTNFRQVQLIFADPIQTTKTISSHGRDLVCRLPTSGDYAEYEELINSMPDMNSQILLGLPPNIDQSMHQSRNKTVMANLRALSANSSHSDNLDKNSCLSNDLFPILQVYKTAMPNAIDRVTESLVAKFYLEKDDSLFQITTFLQLDLELAKTLLSTIDKSLSAVSFGLEAINFDPTSQTSFNCFTLVSGHVLSSWESHWEGPNKPLEYVKTAVYRALALSKYWDLTTTGNLQLNSIDLTVSFHPKTFLSTLCKQTARDLKTTVDKLKLVTIWDGSIIPQALTIPSPITVKLHLEGASFDGHNLLTIDPESPSLSIAPSCSFAWIKADCPPIYKSFVSIPLYETESRTRLTTEVQVPCDELERLRWLLAGIAFSLPRSP